MKLKWVPFLVLLAAIAAFAPFDGVLLRRTLVADSTDAYALESVVDQTVSLASLGMGDQQMTIRSTSTLTLKTGVVDAEKGSAEVELITSDMKMEMDGLAAMMGDPTANLPKEVKVPGRMDARNRFVAEKAEGPGMTAMMGGGLAMSAALQFIEFPERAVQVGDKWDVVLPTNRVLGIKETTLQGSLQGERDIDGVPAWVVTLEGTIPMDMDMGELAKDNPDLAGGVPVGNMRIVGTMSLMATALVEKQTGRTIELTTAMDNKQKTEMVDMGVTIDVSGKTTTKMVLKK